jgi:hypothetical protein
MLTFMQAIAREEGFNAPGTLPNRRNNPGDIEDGPFAQANGALPSDGTRFAHFPDADTGFAAMRVLLNQNYLGLTVSQALNKWAPPVENATNAYIDNVCTWTGLTPDTVLTAELIG